MKIALVTVLALVNLFLWSVIFYRQFFKRFWDIILSATAIVVLSPLLLVLAITGAIKMKGNPFFSQLRPGKKGKDGKERLFKLIKFRSMTCEKDKEGNLLPDEKRLTNYGKKLRATSLDELPELFNILRGDMSIVGPRPLLVEYLSRYNAHQRRRHEVRPGFSGLAQVHGRNSISWEKKLDWDVLYVDSYSLFGDIRIILETIRIVFRREGISSDSSVTMEEFKGSR